MTWILGRLMKSLEPLRQRFSTVDAIVKTRIESCCTIAEKWPMRWEFICNVGDRCYVYEEIDPEKSAVNYRFYCPGAWSLFMLDEKEKRIPLRILKDDARIAAYHDLPQFMAEFVLFFERSVADLEKKVQEGSSDVTR